jgi:hypothetical protein
MKTFPPLHESTQDALAPILEFAPIDRLAQLSLAAFNAEIAPGLAALMLFMKLDSAMKTHPGDFLWLKKTMPPVFEVLGSLLDSVFGNVSAAAARAGDLSFFAQVSHCLERSKPGDPDAALNLAWLASYLTACDGEGEGYLPQASDVSAAFNAYDPKTVLPAKLATEACAKKALSLPLAPGARGKKKKVE